MIAIARGTGTGCVGRAYARKKRKERKKRIRQRNTREAFSRGMNACIETNGFHGARRYHLQMIYNPPGLLNTADFSHVYAPMRGEGEKGQREERIVIFQQLRI